ncbi:MAG TPA: transcriptional regulator [Phycisphaerae bacterium]|nr:transcriptional regulator [Phycisphaerae bacterium]
MDENTFQRKLTDLLREIGNMPEEDRIRLEALAAETKERHEKLKKTVISLQEALDYLRLSIKYLLFDLEATRRENGQLRKMLEDQSGE